MSPRAHIWVQWLFRYVTTVWYGSPYFLLSITVHVYTVFLPLKSPGVYMYNSKYTCESEWEKEKEKKKHQLRNQTRYLLVNTVIIKHDNKKCCFNLLIICSSIHSYSSVEDGSLCFQCVCCSNQLYTLLLMMWNGCACTCESGCTCVCVFSEHVWVRVCVVMQLLLVSSSQQLCGPNTVQNGKPALNEDSTYILPCGLKGVWT